MAGVNNWTWYDENLEKNKKSETDLYNEFVKWFSGEHVSSLWNTDKNDLIRNIMTQDAIAGTDIEKELKKYIAKNENFTGLDISKINIYQLRRYVAGNFAQRKNNEKLLKEQILSEYNISADEYAVKLEKKVQKLDDIKIKQCLNNQDVRKKECESLAWFNLEPLEEISILTTISEKESAKRLNRLSEHDKVMVLEVLERAKYRKIVENTDIQILIDSGYLSEPEVKELVRKFIPHMNLQKAVDLGLISSTVASSVREEYIKKYAKDTWVDITSDIESEIVSNLSLSEILISTDTLKPNVWDYKKIAHEIGFHNFEKELKEKNEEISEQLREQWPATFDLLKESILSLNNPHFHWFEKFQQWAILEFTYIIEWEEKKQFLKIVSYDDSDKNFSFQKIGSDSINLSANSKPEYIDYVSFLENLRWSRSHINVLTKNDVQEGINSWNIKTTELQSFTEDDFSWNDKHNKREEVKNRRITQLEAEKQALEKELENDADSTLIAARLNKKQSEIDSLIGSNIDAREAATYATFLDFIDKLNEKDPDGKGLGFEKGIFIETKENAFLVDGFDIEWETIALKWLLNPFEEVSFADFYEAFKKQKATRAKSLESVHSLIERVSTPQEWWKVEFSWGKLIEKEIDHKWQKAEQEIEYLVSKESDVLAKIVDISDGYVEIQRWEREDTKDGQKLKIKWVSTENYSLNEFAKYIESEKLRPDWQLWKTWLEVDPDDSHNVRNNGNSFWGVMWKIFMNNRMSFAEIAAGWKMIPELVEEYWKKWSDIKSAKAALAMWKLLPKQMRDELLVKVEKAEWESMEKALEDLWKIDSWMAVERIENWLLDKNTPEYNKEAGLLFMLQKYGHLTSKNAMYPYRWKWLWYEAFGWRVNDELFLRKKKEIEDDWQNFSEEYLVWMLLKEQCKWVHYSWIKRRSRLHKEFEWKFKSWMEEEFEKWYKDASTKRTAAKMVAEGMDEALGGTTTNALGWMKKAVERWGSLEDMMEISFSLMYSWASFDIDQASYLRAKWLWDGEGQPIISQRMMSSKDEMNLFNDTVLELAKEMQAAYPQFNWIQKEAQTLRDDAKNRKKPEKERLKNAQNFWKKYGKALSRALNMSMQPKDESEFSITDTIIKRKKWENPVFKKYYEKVKWYVEETDNTFKVDFVEDAIWDTWVFGLNTYKLSKKYLEISQWGTFKKWTGGERVWKRMKGDINATPFKLMEPGVDLNSEINRQTQKSYITMQLTEICAWLLAAHGGNQTALWALNNNTSLIWSQLNAWWINMKNDLWEFSAEWIKDWEKKAFFQQVAENIISWGTLDLSDIWETPVELRVKETKDKTSSATKWGIDDGFSL